MPRLPPGRRPIPSRLIEVRRAEERPPHRYRRARLAAASAGWLAILLALVAVHVIAPQRSGLLAITQVMEPFILLTAILAAPLAIVARRGWQPLVAIALLAVIVLRYGPLVASLPATQAQDGVPLEVATLNVLAGGDADRRTVDAIRHLQADLVGLQELQPSAAAAIEADSAVTALFPYRVLAPDRSVLGTGLLSRYPIGERTSSAEPPLIRAVVSAPDERPVAVFVAHPMPARIAGIGPLPLSLDATRRDEAIGLIRSLIDRDLASGLPVIVLGDLNVTEREPAYGDIAQGLRDAHLDAGIGPGLTWRPPSLAWLPFGLLRIDYVLSSPEIAARATHVECGGGSDHCLVVAELVLGRSPPVPPTP